MVRESAVAKDLRKFVNLRCLKTCDLRLMRELFCRHIPDLNWFHLVELDHLAESVRVMLRNFFAGSEEYYPPGLIADLHQIAELGTAQGMRVLQERARAMHVKLVPAVEAESESYKHDAK